MKYRGARILLALDALVFAAFGALYWVIPVEMAAKVGIVVPTTGAIVDVQGLYGGLELGFGLFLAYCARTAERTRLGLVAGALGLGGIAISRLVAIAHFGMPDTSVAVLVGLDLVGAIVNAAFLRTTRSESIA